MVFIQVIPNYQMKQVIIESNISFSEDDRYLLPIKQSLIKAKKIGFSDRFLSKLLSYPLNTIKNFRYKYKILPVIKQIGYYRS